MFCDSEVSHHKYMILKHLNCMFDRRRHRSDEARDLPLAVEEKLRLGVCSSSSRSPNRTSPSAYNNMFLLPLDSAAVALVGKFVRLA